MKQAATLELFSYWDALRARLDRAFLDAAPERMRALLANTFLIEVDVRRAYPLRVVGGTLSRLTANARLGASFLECWEPTSQDLLEAMLQAVHDERTPVVIGALARGRGEAQLSVEVLLLPLAAGPGGKPRILGGLAPVGTLRRRVSPAPFEIVSARAIRKPTPRHSFARPQEARGDPPVSAATARPAGEHYAHLRVIDGGRSNSAQV